jgi:hypothetical protein
MLLVNVATWMFQAVYSIHIPAGYGTFNIIVNNLSVIILGKHINAPFSVFIECSNIF